MGRFPTPFRGLTQDIRIGLRQLWATPIVTAVAILSLALDSVSERLVQQALA
jgi:hypothetical protein